MKKFLSILLILFLTFLLSACAPNESKPLDSVSPEVEKPANHDSKEDTEDPIEQEIDEGHIIEDEDDKENEKISQKEVDLYFANAKYVELGDESLDHLKIEKRMIDYKDTLFQEAVVKELIKGTKAEDLTTGIPETVNLLGVKVIESIAYVDFAMDGLSGGSLQESLTIEQIVETLTNLEGVDKVQFLIDGQEAESLMGHISIDQPFPGGDKKEKEVNLYFANNKYIETGDESLEALKIEKRTITFENMLLEKAVVEELVKGPENKDNISSSMLSNIKILDVTVKGDTVYVDFSSDNPSGGSTQESFIIKQLVETLLHLDTVEKVQLLIDGEIAESLMGHLSIDKPFLLNEY